LSDNEDRPILGLADLEVPVSESFLQYFRRKIYRRQATAQFAQFSMNMPLAIFVEILSIIVHLFKVVDGKKGKSG
jgi:hypothetical protein